MSSCVKSASLELISLKVSSVRKQFNLMLQELSAGSCNLCWCHGGYKFLMSGNERKMRPDVFTAEVDEIQVSSKTGNVVLWKRPIGSWKADININKGQNPSFTISHFNGNYTILALINTYVMSVQYDYRYIHIILLSMKCNHIRGTHAPH